MSRFTSPGLRRKLVPTVALLGAVALVAGCGSSSSTTTTPSSAGGGTPASTSTGGGSSPSGVAALVAAGETGTPGTSDIPSVANASQVKGKTLVYIPILQAVPSFTPTIQGLKDATSKLGMTLSICDGKANPSATSACIQQAISEKAAGVVFDSIPVDFAAAGFANLAAAKIPAVIGDENAVNPTALLASVGGGGGVSFTKLGADFTINDSGGKADALLIEVVDSSSTIQDMEQGAIAEFASKCPGCKTKVIKISTEQLGNLPSLIGSSLVQDPKIDYINASFDTDVPAVIGGLQTANNHKVKVVGSTSVLQTMQALGAKQYVVADAGYSAYQEGWEMTDQVLRMATSVPAIADDQPGYRLFTANNIGSISLTADAANNGKWFDLSFVPKFLTAWGVS